MSFKMYFSESLRNLFTAKLRSFLAILGVLVGTGAVVALMASSRLATNHALSQFKSLGTNLLALDLRDKAPGKKTAGSSDLTLDNMSQVIKSSSQIVTAAPYIDFYEPIVLFGKRAGNEVLAATDTIQPIAKIHLVDGRFISFLDRNEFYCIIGSDVAKAFQKRHINPIGQQIQVGHELFTVIGVAAPWKMNLFLLVDLNKAVIIPLRTAYLLQNHAKIHDVLFRLIKDPDLPKAKEQISGAMRHLVSNARATFRDPAEIITLVSNERKTFNDLLLAIGSIALVVGGIGVMNIMLVSVIERRREIGIRMAVGARRRNILTMFLIETGVLTVFGGLIGILLGLGVTYVLAYVAGWEFHFYFMPPLLGFIVSVLVGILSGFYPAWRASRLDPIACLTQ